MLQHYGKTELFKRSTLEEDRARLAAVQDFRMQMVLLYNVQRKWIYHQHLKLLQVMRGILERITSGEPFSQACFRRVAPFEEADSDFEVYRRRMGLRQYFKELKMNMQRIRKSKENIIKGG
jgi:hypothetical protein